MEAPARALLLAFVVGAPWACTSAGAFECEADMQCKDGARVGRCESNGWCSFPDDGCASGYEYSALAGAGLAGTCVDVSFGSSGEPMGPETPVASTTSVEDTTAIDGSDGTSTSTSTSTSTTSEPLTSGPPAESSSSATSEDSGEMVDPAVFIDDFDRPDSFVLGNGWIEKTPTAFQIVDGQVVFESSANNYQDNLWYRDESELDVEVCIAFRILVVDSDNHPQVHARMQHDDITEPGQLTRYLLYVEGPSLSLLRSSGGGIQAEWIAPLSAPLEAGPWYQLCVVVVGTDPVQLEGRLSIEGNESWALHTELIALDDEAERIAEPGATGSSAADPDQVANLVYDDFTRTILTP